MDSPAAIKPKKFKIISPFVEYLNSCLNATGLMTAFELTSFSEGGGTSTAVSPSPLLFLLNHFPFKGGTVAVGEV